MSEILETIKQKAVLDDWPIYQIFGLNMASDYAFGKRLLPGKGIPNLTFTCVDTPPVIVDIDAHSPIYASQQKNANDESVVSYWHLEGFDMMRYAEIADFYLWEGGILCLPADLRKKELAAIHVLPGVLALWLEMYRGISSLHGAGIKVNEHAVIFLGHKGAGKSTLAMSFAQAGFPLLSDDTIPIEQRNGLFWARPAYPQARLWPEQVEQYIDQEIGLETIQTGYAKRRALLDTDTSSWFWSQTLPISCIYLLHHRDPNEKEGQVEISDLPLTDALVELMRYALAPRVSQALGLTRQRLDFFSTLAQKIPVRRITYPNGNQALVEVHAAVQKNQLKVVP